MKLLPCCLGLLLVSCSSISRGPVVYKRGSELVTNDDGSMEYVTYVTPEEFAQMTDEERQRNKVRIKASRSLKWKPGKKNKNATQAPVDSEESE